MWGLRLWRVNRYHCTTVPLDYVQYRPQHWRAQRGSVRARSALCAHSRTHCPPMHVICGGRQGCSEGLPLEDLAALGMGTGAATSQAGLHVSSPRAFTASHCLCSATNDWPLRQVCQSRSSRRNGLIVCSC